MAIKSDMDEGKRFILCRCPREMPPAKEFYHILDGYIDFPFTYPLEPVPDNK